MSYSLEGFRDFCRARGNKVYNYLQRNCAHAEFRRSLGMRYWKEDEGEGESYGIQLYTGQLDKVARAIETASQPPITFTEFGLDNRDSTYAAAADRAQAMIEAQAVKSSH